MKEGGPAHSLIDRFWRGICHASGANRVRGGSLVAVIEVRIGHEGRTALPTGIDLYQSPLPATGVAETSDDCELVPAEFVAETLVVVRRSIGETGVCIACGRDTGSDRGCAFASRPRSPVYVICDRRRTGAGRPCKGDGPVVGG